jgi:hypothetical protein
MTRNKAFRHNFHQAILALVKRISHWIPQQVQNEIFSVALLAGPSLRVAAGLLLYRVGQDVHGSGGQDEGAHQ